MQEQVLVEDFRGVEEEDQVAVDHQDEVFHLVVEDHQDVGVCQGEEEEEVVSWVMDVEGTTQIHTVLYTCVNEWSECIRVVLKCPKNFHEIWMINFETSRSI